VVDKNGPKVNGTGNGPKVNGTGIHNGEPKTNGYPPRDKRTRSSPSQSIAESLEDEKDIVPDLLSAGEHGRKPKLSRTLSASGSESGGDDSIFDGERLIVCKLGDIMLRALCGYLYKKIKRMTGAN